MLEELQIPDYEVELWDINGVLRMDVSDIMAGDLSIKLKLNQIDTCDISLDKVQFELKCNRVNINPRVVLAAGRTELKVKRNGVYIFAGTIEKIGINLNAEESNKIFLNAFSYLFLLKTRIAFGNYANKTYAEMARQLITDDQARGAGYDFGFTLGIDTASPVQSATRERNYSERTTTVYEAIQSLIRLENDNFDIELTPDKVFSTYERLGSDFPNVVIQYGGATRQNESIKSMSPSWDSSTLANRITAVGGGFGESIRLESISESVDSIATYRVRERTEQFSDVSVQATLDEKSAGLIPLYQSTYDLPSLDLVPNGFDISLYNIGDAITAKIAGTTIVTTPSNESILATSIEEEINGLYRIIEMSVKKAVDGDESVTLDKLEKRNV